MASDKLRTLTDSNFDQEIKNGVVLVDFWAEWCGPCRRIAPIVEELAGQYDGRATVGKLNVDENPNVPGRFMIRGIPTLLLFKDGQLADTLVGLAPKEDIARMIDRHLRVKRTNGRSKSCHHWFRSRGIDRRSIHGASKPETSAHRRTGGRWSADADDDG